jgi:predicted DNA-binding protein
MEVHMERQSFTLRVPIETARRLDALAQTAFGGASRAAVVRLAIARFLDDTASPRS